MYFGALTYDEFHRKYINQINPATGAAWRIDEVAAIENLPVSVIDQWVTTAQIAHAVELGYSSSPVPSPVVYPPPAPVAVPPSAPPAGIVPPEMPPLPPGVHPRPFPVVGQIIAEQDKWNWTTVAVIGLGIWALARR